MNGRRIAATVATVFGVAAIAGTSVIGAPAAAEPPSALGWWTQRPGAAPLGPGAFEIAAGLQGETSVAAVRATVALGSNSPRLVLTEASAAPDGTAFRGCRARAPWEPADAGAWDDRPAADCADAVDAVRVGAGEWSIDLAPLLAGGTTIDIVLVPAPVAAVPGLGGSVGFTATFSAAEVEATPPTTATTIRPSGGTSGPSARPSSSAGSPLPGPRPAPSPSTGSAAPTTTATTAAAPPTTAAGGPGVTIAAPIFESSGGRDDDRPWGRLLLLVPLSAVAGLAAAASRNTVRRRSEAVGASA